MSLFGLSKELAELERAGLIRRPRVLGGAKGPVCDVDGRRVVLFCSNDYLGLSVDPRLERAALEAVAEWGVGGCSSRAVSGTRTAHRRLEERLAEWLCAGRALLMPTGFMANLAVLTSLAGREDVIFSDELNHASIVRGCRSSRARVVIYPHRDLDVLHVELSKASNARRRIIVTDAIFSVDGDEAPLRQLADLADRHGAALIADEAHSLGVLGPQGRGLCAAASFQPDVLVGTFGKAFGVMGAFVAGTAETIELLESRAVPYIYTTAPPPMLARVTESALELVREADDARRQVLELAQRLRSGLRDLGCETGGGSAHIVPQLVPGIPRAMAAAEALYERGVFVQALRPPTVPVGRERLRWTPSALHTIRHVDEALEHMSHVLDGLHETNHEVSE